MFTDHSSQVIGFSSISQQAREVSENGTQTPARSVSDAESQCKSVLSVESQTETLSSELPKYDQKSLEDFLNRVAPLIDEELSMSIDLSDIDEETVEGESSAVRLESFTALAGADKKVSSLSWSSTGGTLAVASAVLRHDSWCNHEGELAIYTTGLNKPTPPRVVATGACITAVAFHPWEPSVLAVGWYNGEVVIRDLRKEDDWATRESTQEHEGQVVHLGWCGTTNEVFCLSAGADGKILLRKYSPQSRTLSIINRFLITKSHLNQKNQDKDEGVEITALAEIEGDNCVVAVGGGNLLYTRLAPLRPILTHPDYYDPVLMVYEPHRAVITAITKSNTGNFFASISCDGELRVYVTPQIEPKYVVQTKGCLLDVFWTDAPFVLGVCGISNKIQFIRASTGQTLELFIELNGKFEATRAEVNTRRNTLAIGDADGKVELWRLTVSKRTE